MKNKLREGLKTTGWIAAGIIIVGAIYYNPFTPIYFFFLYL